MRSQSLREKTISQQMIFKGRVFDMVRQSVRLPNGKTSTRDLVLHPGAVAMIPVDARGNILLIRQFRKAVDREILELPAGTREPGEPLKKCVQRELQEEIGFKAKKIEHLVSFHPAPGYTTEIIHIYVVRDLTPSRIPGDQDEFIRVVPMRPRKLWDLILQKKIQDSKTIIGMLYWKNMVTAT